MFEETCKSRAFDESTNRSVEMTAATELFPNWCQAVLPSLDTDFGCEPVLVNGRPGSARHGAVHCL